jgi:electron transport complex protein RnfD
MGIKLSVGASPHVRNNVNTNIVMIDFLISLLPIILVAIAVFKMKFIILLLFSLLIGILIDYLSSVVLKIEGKSCYLSSIITTLLLILTLPINTPLWIVFFGITFSLIVGKLIFGGLGQNLFNPALLGRVFLMMSFPQYIFQYNYIDNVTGATMLQL